MTSKVQLAYKNLKTRYDVNVLLFFLLWCHLLWIIIPPFMDFKTGGWATKPHHSDFMSFWTAARFVLDGHALDAYNSDLMKQAQIAFMGYDDPRGMLDWLFPPIAFFMVAPFGLINYSVARFVWMAVTVSAYALVVWKINPRKTAFLAALAAPALVYNCIFTQTGALTAALLGGMVLCLPKKPILAGILIGLLVFKPQLGILIPFALIAGGYWRSLISAVVTVVFLAGAATVVFSFASWEAFQLALEKTVQINLLSDTAIHGIMQTPYSFAQLLTNSVLAATITQVTASVVALIAVIVIWRGAYSLELKGAVLIVATAASSFYFQIYEFPMLILASLMIVRLGHKNGFFHYEVDLMVLAAAIPYIYMASSFPLGLISIGIMVFLVARRFNQEHKLIKNTRLPSRV